MVQGWCHARLGDGRQSSQGFTLIEMLLVIALMGILAAVGLSAYRMHWHQQQVRRASDQMQQIIQAAMAYQVEEHAWPEHMDDVAFVSYLPEGLQNVLNPWGLAYVLTHPNRHRLGVQTTAATPEMAQRLAGTLPNATVDDQKRVTTEIAMPAQSSIGAQGGSIRIVKVGAFNNVRDGQRLTVEGLACPEGRLAIRPSIVAIRPKIERLTGGDPIAELAVHGRCDAHQCTLHVTHQEEINFGQRRANGLLDIQYLVLCEASSPVIASRKGSAVEKMRSIFPLNARGRSRGPVCERSRDCVATQAWQSSEQSEH